MTGSRFRAVVHRIQGPLEFLRSRASDPARGERDPTDAALRALCAGLEEAAGLAVPAAARARFAQARKDLEGAAGDVSRAIASADTRLAPLLDRGYPRQVLASTPEIVPGVGPKVLALLAKRGITSVEQMLFLLPRAYDDRRLLRKIDALEVGHPACFEARVTRCGVASPRSGRRYFEAVVADDSGAVQLRWFRGVQTIAELVKPGVRLLVAGEVKRYRYARLLNHPDVDVLAEGVSAASFPRIVPVYPVVDGIAPRVLRRIVGSAVALAADLLDGHLPEALARELDLPTIGSAMREVHAPRPHLDPDALALRTTPYHLRLVAEELLLLQAGLALRRSAKGRRATLALPADSALVRDMRAALPFALTDDQERAHAEIARDLARPHPMNRLLLGDVGTGKTVVAFLASGAARAAGGVTAVLAPTEILARQHYETFRSLARPHALRVALLTGQSSAAERRSLARLLRLGEIAIVIGTHALIAERLQIPKLRLVVIDEQHRFGVEQRGALIEKGENPHVLVMTATPIPRTLALTVFGDLDHSVLRERPPGRAPVETRVVASSAARRVLELMRETVARREQVYVVYPLVEESEKQDVLDATRGYERLRASLPEARVALVHGQMDPRERTQTMERFAAGEVDVLVATTVIEVGVDVPAATLLVVRHAERFGLAQLHQLRGRVGRGTRPGRAILIGDPKSPAAARRLAVLETSQSGFDIAEQDLRGRGAGEWLGTRQAGHLPELELVDLAKHADLVLPVRRSAARLLEQDPDLRAHPELRSAITRRWGRRLDLSTVI